MRHLLLTLVAAALLVACGGGKAPTPEEACRGLDGLTDVQRAERGCYISGRPTPDVKATAMAQAERFYELMDNSGVSELCKARPELGCFSPEEKAALRPSLVLEQYAHIIRDTELEAQAAALYEQTKAAWEAAHAAVPPVIVVRPAAPPVIYNDSGAAQRDAQRRLDDLRRCINLNLNDIGVIC